jgi:hypothetical protein
MKQIPKIYNDDGSLSSDGVMRYIHFILNECGVDQRYLIPPRTTTINRFIDNNPDQKTKDYTFNFILFYLDVLIFEQKKLYINVSGSDSSLSWIEIDSPANALKKIKELCHDQSIFKKHIHKCQQQLQVGRRTISLLNEIVEEIRDERYCTSSVVRCPLDEMNLIHYNDILPVKIINPIEFPITFRVSYNSKLNRLYFSLLPMAGKRSVPVTSIEVQGEELINDGNHYENIKQLVKTKFLNKLQKMDI